jgi:hypothetical protein
MASSADVCFTTFIRTLVDKYGYQLRKYTTSTDDFYTMLQAPFGPKTLIQFGKFYLFRLAHETALDMVKNDCMIFPFLKQLCDEHSDTIDYNSIEDTFELRSMPPRTFSSYTIDDTDEEPYKAQPPEFFFIGFSTLNWCRIVSACFVQFPYNHIEKRMEATIETVCAFKPYDTATERALKPYGCTGWNTKRGKEEEKKVLLEPLPSVLCELNNLSVYDASTLDKLCQSTKEEVLRQTKLRLGQLLLWFVTNTLQVEHHTYDEYKKVDRGINIRLSCDQSLVPYYLSLGFLMGPSNAFRYNEPFARKTMKGIRYEKHIQTASWDDIEDWYSSQQQNEVEARKWLDEVRVPRKYHLRIVNNHVRCTKLGEEVLNMHYNPWYHQLVSVDYKPKILQKLLDDKDRIVALLNLPGIFDVPSNQLSWYDMDHKLRMKDNQRLSCFELMFNDASLLKATAQAYHSDKKARLSKKFLPAAK